MTIDATIVRMNELLLLIADCAKHMRTQPIDYRWDPNLERLDEALTELDSLRAGHGGP